MDSVSNLPNTTISLSSESYEPTAALQYVNSQLVSHGFARSPGLSFDGLGNTDSERLVKCVLEMLAQRTEDVRRTEELFSKLRTLNYENERLQSMHQAAVNSGANAEREMHAFKSKLAASQKSLAHEITAHKQTTAELQRTRTSLQFLRSTTQNELKRKDRELERLMERWNKVSDVQAKLLVTPSGLRCANFVAGTAESARGPGLIEQALEQAEEFRGELVKENDAFRTVLLNTTNTIQNIIYTCRCLHADAHVEELPPLSHPGLFAPPTSMLSQPENAHAKLRELFSVLRNAISNVSLSVPAPLNADLPENESEIKRLNELITSLRTELQQSRQSSSTLAAQSQALLDRFTTHASERLVSGRDPTPEEAAEMSLELMSVPERDAVRAKLEARTAELKKERERFTEATVKLGKERAELEADRAKMLEEKRRWAVEQMLAELPPTPGPDPDLLPPPKSKKMKLKQDSPPRIRPRKAGGPRSTLGSPSNKATSQKRAQGSVAPNRQISRELKRLRQRRQSGVFGTLDILYEPDVEAEDQPSDDNQALQRSTTPEDSPPVAAPMATETGMKTSLPLVLPTTFTLPPPSPASCFTTMDLGAVPSQSPVPPSQQQPPPSVPNFNDIPLATTSATVVPAALPRSRTFPPLRTPHTPPNPLLKHAYSPIRPSPLSRILMLADSPLSPPSILPISEDQVYKPANVPAQAPAREPEPPIDEPSPLRERAGGDSNGSNGAHDDLPETGDEKRFTPLKEEKKGKERAVPVMHGPTASEKENTIVRSERKQKVSAVGASNARTKASTRPETKRAIGARPISKPLAVKSAKTATGASAGPSSQAGPSTMGGNMKLGDAKRVPIHGATTEKSGARKA